jgi:DnaA family protein
MQQLPLGVRLRDRAVFESYFAAGNAEVKAHLEQVACGARHGASWIWGPPGVGKTHLLQAVCARAGAAGGAGYLPLAQFAASGPAVLEGWGQLDCVCLDEVSRVAAIPAWEAALFELYRVLEERGAALVVAAEEPPALVPWTLRDLGSRLAASTVFQLHELDESAQREALTLRARLRGLELPPESVQYLQRRLPREMTALCRMLDTLDEAALRAQRRLTVPFIREVLGDPEGTGAAL